MTVAATLCEDAPESRHPFHPVARPKHYGAWGHSHYHSKMITGTAATLTGVTGYPTPDEPNQTSHDLARAFLKAIFDSHGSPEPLYHGFKNRSGRAFPPGQMIELPLMAASGDMDGSAGYGVHSNPNNIPAVVFAFPKGTPMAGYSHHGEEDAKDFGYTWAEAIVGGRFRIGDSQERTVYGWRDMPKFTLVALEPVAVFDPDTRQWKNR